MGPRRTKIRSTGSTLFHSLSIPRAVTIAKAPYIPESYYPLVPPTWHETLARGDLSAMNVSQN